MYQDYNPPVYDRLYTMWKNSSKPCVPEADRLDQAMLDVHFGRLGCGAVLKLGQPRAIYDKHFHLLDPASISAVAKRRGSEIFIPAPFAEDYFGEELPKDACGYVNLTSVCAERNIQLYRDEKTDVVCIMPPDVRPANRSTDPAFLDRMARVFEDPYLPMPKYNVSQGTRQAIVEAPFPNHAGNWMEKDYICLYSPGLLIREEKGKTVYYVIHENSHCKAWEEMDTETVMLRSEDRGETWQTVTVWPNIRWGWLFEVNDVFYLCGNRVHPSQELMIARVEADGKLTEVILPGQSHLVNPHNVIKANGRIYIPTTPAILSADLNADLLDPASWTYSNPLNDHLSRQWFLESTGCDTVDCYWVLEGNMVQSPNGQLYNMARLECQPYNGYAGLCTISPDGKEQLPDPRCNGLVEMPTSVSRFCVRYDEATGLYLALTSYPSLPTPIHIQGGPPAGQRNVLALVASPDLLHWKVLDILLADTEVMNAFCSARAHGFQYVVWDVDGNDLVYVVREASGYTNLYHDGTSLTLYRLKDYAAFVKERYAVTDFYENPYNKRLASADF